jgi:hypothetical protein
VQGAVVEVAAGSEEYLFAEARFRERSPGVGDLEYGKTIVKIERVQNTVLWNMYFKTRKEVASDNHGDANEL